jgi:hypothetical protein
MTTLLKKSVSFNSKPTIETFPELPNIVIWVRCILAIFYGVWLGVGSVSRGGAGVMFGLNFITFLPIVYCSTYLRADQDSYGTKIFFGGVANSLALMLLIWVYFYTVEHADDELKLADALVAVVKNVTMAEDGAVVEEAIPVVEESEF